LINDLNASLCSFIYLVFAVRWACSRRIRLQEHSDVKSDVMMNYCLIATEIFSEMHPNPLDKVSPVDVD
jgi:hypothetical protein